MPPGAWIPIIFVAVLVPVVIALAVISLINVRQCLTETVAGHVIEVRTGFWFARLTIDGNVVDELRSYQMHTAKLNGTTEGLIVVVNIGSGFLKPIITTFINGEKSGGLSNR